MTPLPNSDDPADDHVLGPIYLYCAFISPGAI